MCLCVGVLLITQLMSVSNRYYEQVVAASAGAAFLALYMATQPHAWRDVRAVWSSLSCRRKPPGDESLDAPLMNESTTSPPLEDQVE